VRLAASGEGEGGSYCFFLTWFSREEDLAVRGRRHGNRWPVVPAAPSVGTEHRDGHQPSPAPVADRRARSRAI